MKLRLLIVASLVSTAVPLAAQTSPLPVTNVEFPTFTMDQNWARISSLWTSALASSIANAKAHGQSEEEYGRWNGNLFAPGWGQPNSGSVIRIARSIQNNARSLRGTTTELVSVHDTAVTLRMSRPYVGQFTGPGRSLYTVTLDEYELVNKLFYEQIASRVGLRTDYRIDSAWVTLSLSGRGTDAVIEFPRGTYAVTVTAQDAPDNPQMVGAWESTYAPDGRFTVRHDGAVAIEGSYEIALDQIVLRNERGTTACPAGGKYRWTVNKASGNLSMGRLSDDCDPRFRYLTRRAFTKK